MSEIIAEKKTIATTANSLPGGQTTLQTSEEQNVVCLFWNANWVSGGSGTTIIQHTNTHSTKNNASCKKKSTAIPITGLGGQ